MTTLRAGIDPRNWRYAQAGKRDLRLDLLRGYAVFAMIADHVGGPSPLHLLTGGNRFFVSAAEAFVFISGVTVGIVYGKLATTEGVVAAARKALARSWVLYAIAVWLGLALVSGSAAFGLPRGAPLREEGWRFVLDVVTLQRTYYLIDVMLLYAFLMALAPLALWLMLKRKWWVLLAGSWALWAAYQRWPDALQLPWPIADNPVFKLAAWQVLFFTGLVLGYGRDRVAALAGRLPRLPGGSLPPLALATGVLIWLHVTNGAVLDGIDHARGGAGLLDDWFDKSALPVPRLVACAIVFGFGWSLTTRLWRPVRALTGRALLPLGQAALYAYGAHVVAVLAIELALETAGFHSLAAGEEVMGRNVALMVQAGTLALIWAAASVTFGQRQISWLGRPPMAVSRRAGNSRWQLSPSLGAVGAVFVLGVIGVLVQAPQPGGAWAVPVADASDPTGAKGPSQARRVGNANPVTTVTALRRAADAPGQPTVKPVAAQDLPDESSSKLVSPADDGPQSPPSPLILELESAGLASTTAALFDATFTSAALGHEMPLAVYLPPGYASSDERYPVLYMLHGAGGHYTEWITYGLPVAAAQLMAAGEIPPVIIVMPEGESGYWVNGLTGDGERWADYIIQDLVPHIDATYRTTESPAARGIGGLSRGGFGALYLAFRHPDVFGVTGGHSPTLPDYWSLDSPLISPDEFGDYDPVVLAEWMDSETFPQIWLDMGTQDDWIGGFELLHTILSEREIPHYMVEMDEGHTPEYWASHAEEYIRFYAAVLSGQPAPLPLSGS